MEKNYLKDMPEWHPIMNYFSEAKVLKGIIAELETTDFRADPYKFFNLFNHLMEVDRRFTRKENQLFPYLEKHNWPGPSIGMWSFHDSIRAMLKEIRIRFENRHLDMLQDQISYALGEIKRLNYIEENHLFPNALQLLTENEWEEMSRGEEEIGFMSGADFRTLLEKPEQDRERATENFAGDISSLFLKMDEGNMTIEQINLMLRFIPFDLTYVDEHDRVRFYNRGEVRVFPRSAGVIGREVRFCHPPKSVNTVLRILDEFKKGTKDEAEFWINYRGKLIHIRYFAIRDKEKQYRGVIEVSQDITAIQKITGEKRLLDWDS